MDDRILASAPEATDQYLWIVIVGGLGAFFAAFGIGANDVANAFATSVGAKAISLKQAVVLAGIFEFLGAVLLGNHVTKAIRKSIADVDCFAEQPGILMYGMSCVVWSTGLWLLLASYFELPVSTTHSTVGGIVGMAMAYGGAGCVVWNKPSDQFPFIKGVSAIVASWVISPVFSGVLAMILFLTVRTAVLRSENAYQRSFWVYPALVATTLIINIFFIIYKGGKGIGLDDTTLRDALLWAFGIGIGVGLLCIPTAIPWMRKTVEAKFTTNAQGEIIEVVKEESKEGEGASVDKGNFITNSKIGNFVNKQMEADTHASVKSNDAVSAIHDNAEKFDPRAEEVFKYVQVFTAICDSFSHGANDVANAMGPFSAIYAVYKAGTVESSTDLGADGYWILAIGGIGIVFGLALYGYKIISAIGVKLAKITPSRGFSIELGAALVIIIGSRLGIPLSTTHCQVGATMGVALLEGKGGFNYVVLGKAVAGWIITLVVCGMTAAILFSQGAYAPSVFCSGTVNDVEVPAV